jgi:serine/threonine-protein kinase HipA
MPVRRGVFEHRNGNFLGLPGLIYDSLPDRFGMAVIRRHFAEQGEPSPGPLPILSYLGSRTMGALTYEPPEGDAEQNKAVALVDAARSARHLLAHEHSNTLDPALLASGATAGGAMPKILVAMHSDGSKIVTGADQIPQDMEPWLVKLNTTETDQTSKARLEYAYSKMAADCGLNIPPTRLIADEAGVFHYAIRRFDRSETDPNQRLHTQTYASLFHLDLNDPGLDYDDLLRHTRMLTGSEPEVREQFKRMLFNLLAHNRDDHAKNFTFRLDHKLNWTVAPAYDLLFSETDLGGNWMSLNGKRGQISRADLQRLAETHSIPKVFFETTLEAIQRTLARWPDYAEAAGLSAGLTATIDRAIKALRV